MYQRRNPAQRYTFMLRISMRRYPRSRVSADGAWTAPNRHKMQLTRLPSSEQVTHGVGEVRIWNMLWIRGCCTSYFSSSALAPPRCPNLTTRPSLWRHLDRERSRQWQCRRSRARQSSPWMSTPCIERPSLLRRICLAAV